MAREATYFVQAFNAGKGRGDPEMDDYDDEPTVFFRNGQFPAAFG